MHAGCCHASWRLSCTQGLPALKLQLNSVTSIGSCILLCVCEPASIEGICMCPAVGFLLVMHVCTPSGNHGCTCRPDGSTASLVHIYSCIAAAWLFIYALQQRLMCLVNCSTRTTCVTSVTLRCDSRSTYQPVVTAFSGC